MKNSLNNLPDGTIAYVDSNIFIYDATNHPKHAASCSIFLDRVESGENMNLEIINLLVPIFAVALEFMKKYRLMSNDAIHVATMKQHGITNIATNDPDFERVEGLTVWKP